MTPTAPAAPAPDAPAPDAPAPGAPAPEPRSRPRRRWAVLALVVLLVALPLLGALLGVRSSGRALDPDNPAPGGARALAQLLEQGGVPVERVTRAAAAGDALDGDGDGDGVTLVVTDPRLVDPDRLADLAAAASAVVLLQPDAAALAAVAPDLAVGATGAGAGAQDEPLTAAARPTAGTAGTDGTDGADVLPARCGDPDAQAAGEASAVPDDDAPGAAVPLRAAGPGAQVCFGGAYGAATSPGGTPVRVVADGALVSNDLIDVAGNAALALRAAGAQPRVVWLVASPLDAAPDAAPSALQLLPGWVAPLAVQLGLVAVAAVVWRARRFGPLVVEPLPVVVRSVETARGRAALYRASRDRAAAARALRAGARWRLAARLGLPPGTPPAVVAAAAAHAAGRDEALRARAERLLDGPEPPDDAALAGLLRGLDALEAAVAGGHPPSRQPPRQHDPHDAHPEGTP